MSDINWALKQVAVSSLADYSKNPRSLTKDQFKHLKTSLDKFGLIDKPIVNLDNVVIGGHQRLNVLRSDNAQEVECWFPSRQLTDKEVEELNIRLNKNIGSWDFNILSDQFEFDDLLNWGFDEKELLGLDFGDEPQPEEPNEISPDRFEEIATKWQTAEGQMWCLGSHHILCGDSLKIENVKKIMGNDIPALILADPPYGVSIVAANGYVGGGEAYNIPFGGRKKGYVGGENSIKDKTGHYPIENWKKNLTGSDGASKPFGSKAVRGTVGAAHVVEAGKYPVIIGDEDTETAQKAVLQLCELYPEAIQIWWGANYYSPVLPASQCWLVWNKETTGNFADCELAWTNQNKAAKLFTHKWNGMLRDSEHERRWHPTQKPAALAAWIYSEFTDNNAIILDPFAGAGWSVLGGEQSGRKIRAIEKSHEYIAVIIQRWVDMTGGEPILLESPHAPDTSDA